MPKEKPVLRPKEGKTTGVILVDSPEVFGRERLVRDREQQKKWLKDQLTVPDEAFDAFQAQVQSRTSDSTSISVGLDATAAGALAIGQSKAKSGDLEREQEMADLEHQIRMTQLQNDLERLRSGNDIVSQPMATVSSGEAAGATPATTGTTGNAPSPSPAAAPIPAAAAPPSSNFAMATLTVKDSPADRFRDRLAYRELVRQELLENDLDDAHDLDGNTLYRWTFDTTVFPGKETSKWGMVVISLNSGFACNPDNAKTAASLFQLMRGFETALNRMVNFDVQAVEGRLISGNFEGADAETAQLVRAASGTDYRKILNDTDSRIKILESEMEARRSELEAAKTDRKKAELGERWAVVKRMLRGEKENRDTVVTEAKSAAANAVMAEYTRLIEVGKLRSFLELAPASPPNPPIEVSVANGGSGDPGIEAKTALGNFCALVQLLPPARVDPYAVTPKESIERIADMSISTSKQELLLSAALSAGKLGFDSALKKMRELEAQRQAVRRQPLTVGFAEMAPAKGDFKGNQQTQKDYDFGWILGPRFTPRYGDEAGFDFFHKVNQQPLAAVISVPAWWLNASIQVRTCWIEDPATDGLDHCRESDAQTMEVKLPGDAEEIARAIFPRSRRPQPYIYRESPDLEIGRAERIVIYGENLWRNPVVWLGSQAAVDVEILPDMKGIAATFDKVQQPPGWTPTQPFGWAPVWVWTSEGNAVAGDVRLYKPVAPAKADKKPPLFSLTTSVPYIVADKMNDGLIGLTFKIDQKEEKGKKTNLVEKVFLTFENAIVNSDGTPAAPSCLNKGSVPWEVKDSCQIVVHLQGLAPGQIVTIRAFRKDGKEDVHHDAISLEVRR